MRVDPQELAIVHDADGVYEVGEHHARTAGETLVVRGQITQRSTTDPKVTNTQWECRMCGARVEIEQDYWTIDPPAYCPDEGRQRNQWIPRKRDWEYTDYKRLELQQRPDVLTDDKESILVHLTGELARRDLEAGDEVAVVADYLPYHEKGKAVATKVLDAEDVVVEDDEVGTGDLAEHREAIDRITAHDDPVPKLVDSIATDHYGDQHIKEALLLQLVRGNDVESMRGTIHVMLLGDPGTGKTDFGEALVSLAPRGKKASGNSGTSAAGLTGAVVRDSFSDAQFTIKAGAIPQCSHPGGAIFVDELDSASTEDQEAMLEAMESQEINIQKGGREATLEANTAVLAGANPEDGNFRDDEPPADQTKVPSPLLTRFDLIFVTRERTEREEIDSIAGHIVDVHDVETRDARGLEVDEALRDDVEGEIDTEVLRAYLASARDVEPVFADEEVKNVLRKWYVETKAEIVEQESRDFPVTPRSIQDLIRVAEASAKLRHSETVDLVDAERATRLKARSFHELGLTTPSMEVETDDDGNLVDSVDDPRVAVLEAVEELKMESNEYGADRERVAAEAASACSLSIPEVEELVDEMLDSNTLHPATDGRVTA